MSKAKYNTWIRKKKIAVFALISLCLLLFAVLSRNNLVVSLVFVALSIPFASIVFVLSYTYYQFSAFGGNYQSKIHALIVNSITARSGRLLDIGTGSASLIIKAVRTLPKVTATGIDFWGNDWEYSQKLCERNAQIEGVASRVNFTQGSASKLPFGDNEFDIVISCLTFHEVKDESDKAKVLQEALRVLKNGGEFVFMDLFLDKRTFGNLRDLTNQLGVSQIETVKLDRMLKLPRLLLSDKSLGNAAIMKGTK
jgi:ubiquinone/menaquinone biosynthesis C-methylase UbiE